MRSRIAVAVVLVAITLSGVPQTAGRLSADTVAPRVSHSHPARPTSTKAIRSKKPSALSLVSDANSTTTKDWACIGWNESRDSYTQPGGGRWQFEGSTWTAMTGLSGLPQSYAPSIQNAAALRLYAYDLRVWGNGWHAWSTRFVCGLG